MPYHIITSHLGEHYIHSNQQVICIKVKDDIGEKKDVCRMSRYAFGGNTFHDRYITEWLRPAEKRLNVPESFESTLLWLRGRVSDEPTTERMAKL